MKKKSNKNLFIILVFISISGITSIFASESLICSPVEIFHDTSNINFKELPHTSQKIAWDANGSQVCVQSATQEEFMICDDEASGAIIVWQDRRKGAANIDIYAQHIDSDGILQWEVNGTAICTEENKQLRPLIISDGAGGAITVWYDWRQGSSNTDIYTQRIDSNGIVQWNANGTVICNAIDQQSNPQITSDGAGGAIIIWQDYRSESNSDIYSQRIDSSGIVLWTINGTAICTESHDQFYPKICSDGAGGAIITWEDERNGNVDIYAQRIDSSGVVQWEGNGIAVCTEELYYTYLQICSDGAGGAIIAWEDERNGNVDIYAQRIDSSGVVQWEGNGIAVCTANYNQYRPQLCSDGAGGAIITWYDYRALGNYDIYAQHINLNGSIQWTNNGKPICTADDGQSQPQISSDGAGGAIITWQDYRSGINNDIYAQRIDLNGDIKWVVNGIPICTGDQIKFGSRITTDSSGTAIIVWVDYRNGNSDLYAQKLENPPPTSNHPSNVITSIGGSETINWTLVDDFGSGNYRVLANNTNGDYYVWVDWTSWANNTALNVLINRTNPGYFDYTIQYYDDQHNFGVSDTVIVRILESDGAINGYTLIILLLTSFALVLILTKKLKHLKKF
ncbi:MAG: hypothetical protein HWN81_06955 [Candidatus Lokiarchaeota archaeon]|nr:hypothetical protein [Candidatus Lokiarchaeota archaeon]